MHVEVDLFGRRSSFLKWMLFHASAGHSWMHQVHVDGYEWALPEICERRDNRFQKK